MILEDRANEMKKKDQTMLCSLSFDEMKIRKHQQYCSKTNTFIGTVTYGEDKTEVATNAIVFLMKGVNTHIQTIVANYLITTLSAEQRMLILLDIINECFKRNIIISNITFDGLFANATMCTYLGADIDPSDMNNVIPYFTDPFSERKIYIIVDPSHTEKLVRNNLAARRIFYDSNGNEIKWEFIENLVKFGKNNNFGLAHKISNRHINFKNNKMRVRLAVETLSNSTADSLQFLMDKKVEGFCDAAPTIEFIRYFDRLFDIMNTQRIIHKHPNQFKSALNFHNATDVFTFLQEVKQYILGLKVRKPKTNEIVYILKSNIKTGFRGYLIDIESVIAMYREYIEECEYMHMLPVYRLSQDHLELVFHLIRSQNGCNDNPTAQQYFSGMRKVQMISTISEIIASPNANISRLNILRVASTPNTNDADQQSTNQTESAQQAQQNEENYQEVFLDLHRINRGDHLIDKCNDSAISFVAYKIEQRLLQCDQIHCRLCERVLLENEKMKSEDCIGKNTPCKSTYEICRAADKAVKQFVDNAKKDFKVKVIHSVMSNVNFNELYPLFFEPMHNIDDKHFLVRFIIKEYIHIKCTFISKQKTLEMHENYFRNSNRKAVHFANQ